MTAAPHPSWLITIGIAALIAWRLYSRVRRMVGRQKLSRVRPWITVTLFPLLLALLLFGALAHPLNALTLIAGIAAGAGLGLYGLRLTRFEVTPQGRYYTPSAHLGIALSLLFIARVGYRLAHVYFVAETTMARPMSSIEIVGSPITLAIFGTLAGYYVSYAIGLLRWAHTAEPAPAPADPA